MRSHSNIIARHRLQSCAAAFCNCRQGEAEYDDRLMQANAARARIRVVQRLDSKHEKDCSMQLEKSLASWLNILCNSELERLLRREFDGLARQLHLPLILHHIGYNARSCLAHLFACR